MMMMRGNTFCFFEAHFLENTNGGNIWKIQGVFFSTLTDIIFVVRLYGVI